MSRVSVNTFTSLAADGQSAAMALPGLANSVHVYLNDTETWGSGTLILESSVDGTNWVAVPSASWTSGDGHLGTVDVLGGQVRLSLSGSTTPTLAVTLKAVAYSGAVAEEGINLTANGNTDLVLSRAGKFAVFATGTWDSGSLTVSVTPDGTLYVDSGMTAVTADGGGVVANAADDAVVRLVLASVVTASDLDVVVISTDL